MKIGPSAAWQVLASVPRRWVALGAAATWLVAAMLAAVLPAQHRQIVAMRQAAHDAASLDARRLAATSAPVRPALPPAERFRTGFDPAATRQVRLEALLDAVDRHGLRWQRSELRQGGEPALSLTRQQLTLPMNGTYASLRALIDDALVADAGLSLDRLQLSRASSAAAEIEVETAWSLWARHDPGERRGLSNAVPP